MAANRSGVELDAVRVGRARTELGLTQEQLALAAGVSRLTVNRIENGRTRVSLETVERLAVVLRQSRAWLQGLPETIDPVERARFQVSEALEKLAAGFNDLNDALTLEVQIAKNAKVAA